MTRLSIVTPVLNQRLLLDDLIDCVRDQEVPEVQHIVVDAGSTDGTVELLRRRSDEVTWISEPDGGQAEAINKGFALADGDVLAWINCDDRYTPGALRLVLDVFAASPSIDLLYGDALATDLRGRAYGVRTHVRPCDLDDLVRLGDPIVQPAAFWTRRLWRDLGGVDASLTYAFDYELWMRAAARTTLVYLPVCLAQEALHGGAKTARGALPRVEEIERVARRHGGPGVPQAFRAEAAAVHSAEALRAFARLDARSGRRHLAAGRALAPDRLRHAAHLFAQLAPGTGTLPRLRLLANRWRTWRTNRAIEWPRERLIAEQRPRALG